MEQYRNLENAVISMDQVYPFLSHLIHFQVCEILFLAEAQKATYLYTLMFFIVVSYCANYVKEIITRKHWKPYVTITEKSNIRHLGMSATKITLEWTKFLIFALTAVFILLTIGFAQEVEGVHTSWPYLAATFLFYLTSEKIVCDDLAERLPVTKLFKSAECREKLFGNILLKVIAILMSSVVNVACLVVVGRWRLVAIATYVNVYLKLRNLAAKELATLDSESVRIRKFRFATDSEIRNFSDVCAICLSDMKTARVTRCRHLFHEHCLSLAIDNNPDNCPTCKSPF